MIKLTITFVTLLIAFSQPISADGPVTEPIPLLIWASYDPAEDSEAGRIDAAKFYAFTEKYRQKFLNFYNDNDIVGATLFLSNNGAESGTEGVIWPAVFAKIAFLKAIGTTEEKQHGLPSLVIWAMRNTGAGTSLESVDRVTLVSFILSKKTDLLEHLHAGDVDGLISYLEETKSQSGSKDVDWKTVINDLKDNRQLFKYACGLLGLDLCDSIKA
ncbi:uncharacterized protein LOC128395657 [Panonychus citri]|uniref:uncharacterized protein LOC128395657 n=1 Tax=Panonychus citri TaxID=50023 RepID=UPI002307184B|nr:uncharacterized protein LOC128395657 [Panonychus citri]